MADGSFEVLTIGNAIVDVLAKMEDEAVGRLGLNKGTMTLIDAARADQLYENLGPAVEISGGSAANTAVGVVSLGGRAAYIGKVRDDHLGGVFRHDLKAAGVHYPTAPATEGPPTARSFIVITPDAQRTMNTYLGACVNLGPADIDEATVAAAAITYLEGYLWDPPQAKEAFRKAAEIAHRAGRKVALTLSDPFCVDRHRESFIDLVKHHVDILFANEAEILSLYQARTFDDALQAVRWQVDVAALTRGPKGSVILERDEVHIIDAVPPARIADTTGAGDLYAAGFLFGHATGRPPAECGRLGSICAAEVIAHVGARPETPLRNLVPAGRQ
ncbi:MAG: adenosine kinase [Thalassobaculales bacterium]